MTRRYPRIASGLAIALAALTLSLVGCSSPSDVRPLDAGIGAGIDAGTGAGIDAAAPIAHCEQAQRAYVDGLLPPAQQAGVTTTVRAVLRAPDVRAAMPYCSGPRPDPR